MTEIAEAVSRFQQIAKNEGGLPYSHGIWGKHPGSHDDFNWIGTSAHFSADRQMYQHLAFGDEKAVEDGTEYVFWRVHEGTCYAVCAYKDVADAEGRRGLGCHVLAWRPASKKMSPVIGALWLLPEVCRKVTEAQERRGQERGVCVLSEGRISCTEDVAMMWAHGREDLASAVADTGQDRLKRLTTFYTGLLRRDRPAICAVAHPLSATALAALMVPLCRKEDQDLGTMSIAGWLVSSKVGADDADAARVRNAWTGVACRDVPRPFQTDSDNRDHLEEAQRYATEVLDAPGAATSGPSPEATPAKMSSAVTAVLTFAKSGKRHTDDLTHIPAEELCRPEVRRQIDEAIRAVQSQLQAEPTLEKHPKLLEARREHLQQKLNCMQRAVQEHADVRGFNWTLTPVG